MKPYYQDDYVTIYHGDCREIVPTLGKFDLLLTDPPYGLGDRWSGGGTWQHHKGIYAEARIWDKERIDAETMTAILSAATMGVVWGGNYYTDMLPPSRAWLAWQKCSSMETVADFELAWASWDYPAKLIREQRNPDGRRQHPTAKPESVMRWCIAQADKRGDAQTILDPFAGSGTTGRAAKDLGRKAVLIEREERYCEIAARRMAQEVLPL
jgi:DNA modification methylase